MKPEQHSESLLGVTRSKAKMFEYSVPTEHHIAISREPARLFPIVIGMLGDLAARITTGNDGGTDGDALRQNVRFAAQFLDAYCQGRFEEALDAYLIVTGAAAYYLCDLPGSAAVLANRIPREVPDLGCSGLDRFTSWLLRAEFDEFLVDEVSIYREEMDQVASWLRQYLRSGDNEDSVDPLTDALRNAVYRHGTPREVLFVDIACALVRKRQQYSARYSLPKYSDHPVDDWNQALSKSTFIRELWPAQRVLGERGVLRGTSALVQMPTSAGKTRATELIIRSEFLSNRAELAVIVAPFRALCHEIHSSLSEAFRGEDVSVDELSDVFQPDFDITELITGKQVIVVTPEKLVYVLRRSPDLADRIGLLIYDEGHQFDNGARGVTYELLLTSLKTLIPRQVQTVLISAVISNGGPINAWLNGADSVVVNGEALLPTFRSLAFASWQDRLGRLEFVSNVDPESREFFVPRLIEKITLPKRPRERKVREFPLKEEGATVALYLAIKLVPSGSVAVFCGRKSSVSTLCELAVDVFDRRAPLESPLAYSDAAEIQRLSYLHEANLGADAPTTASSKLGIFAHHANTPHGIRLAVEHAMRRGHARMVICTSTLAQGVNLPIRYLIVTSTQQGTERIKVRDFHNLLGRAGRSGIHTEGSVLFANPELFDKRNSASDGWRWREVKQLLQPQNSEPCVSALLSILKPLESDDGRYGIAMEPMALLKACLGRRSDFTKYIEQFVQAHSAKAFTEGGLRYQLEEKWKMITAVESFLMAHWDSVTESEPVAELAKRTLAFHLAADNEAEKQQLIELFETIAKNIQAKVPEADRRKVFARTLFGVRDSIAIEKWVTEKLDALTSAATEDVLFELMWTTISKNIQNSTFRRCNLPRALKQLAIGWLNGDSFSDLFEELFETGARFGLGRRPRFPTMDTVVDLCENALAFDGMLAVGAIAEFTEHLAPDEVTTHTRIRLMQKRIKYGLSSNKEITLYEMGLADRVIANEIATLVTAESRAEIRGEIRASRDQFRATISKYPAYFRELSAEW